MATRGLKAWPACHCTVLLHLHNHDPALDCVRLGTIRANAYGTNAYVAVPAILVCYIDRDAQGGAKGKPKQGQCNRRTGHAVSAADILVYDSPLSVMTKGSYGYRL